MSVEFSEEQVQRYSRNILLPEVGVAGQKKLMGSGVLVVGAGGLGSPAMLYLAAGGVGRIGVADGDVVDLSNLQRQILHGVDVLGTNKAVSARDAIGRLNPDCQVDVIAERLTAANIRQIVRSYDVVVDGSDNFPTRFLVADCCWFEKVPLVTAAVLRFEGQLMIVLPGANNPCYRCFIPAPPPAGLVPTCQEAGVFGAVVGAMGALQAVETAKVLLGVGRVLSHRMLTYDGLDGTFKTVNRKSDPNCPLCGANPSITELIEYDASCSVRTDGTCPPT